MVPKQVSGELVANKSEELASSFEDFARKAMGVAPERIPDMSGKDLLIASGIAIEKMQLLRGMATNRTETAQIVYIQPSALRDLSIQVLEGELVTPLSHNQTILEGPKTGV